MTQSTIAFASGHSSSSVGRTIKTATSKSEELIEKVTLVHSVVNPGKPDKSSSPRSSSPSPSQISIITQSMPSSDSEESLEECVRANSPQRLAELFDSLDDEQEKIDAFCDAICLKQKKMVQFFLDQGVSIYKPNSTGQIPLHLAITYSIEIPIMICQKVEVITDEHALFYAIYYQNRELIKLLLEKTPNIPALQEVMARKVLEVSPDSNSPVQPVYFLRCLMMGFRTVPYELIQNIMFNYAGQFFTKDVYQLYSIAFVKDDGKLMDILRAAVPEHEKGAKEHYHGKWLSNVMGMNGQFNIQGTSFSCGGICREVALVKFKQYAKAFFAQDSALEQFPIEKQKRLKHDILGAIDRCHDGSRSLSDIVKSIQSGQTEVFVTGWRRHVITYIFSDKTLIVCNRGDESGARPGLIFFSYRPKKVTKDIITSLHVKMANVGDLTPAEILYKVPVWDLGARSFEPFLPMKEQGSCNCVWASMKAAFYGLILSRRRKNPLWPEKIAKPQAHKMDRKAYKAFSRFSRKRARATEYQQMKNIDTADTSLLKALKKKFDAKGIYWLDLKGLVV